MTNQNNAAQPGLTDDEINAACGRHAADTGWHAENDRKKARAVESALLSKLRAEGVQAGAPVADERAAFEAIVKRLGGDCTWRPGYGYVSSMTRLYQNFWRQIHAEQGNFAMMLHQRGERITSAAPQASEAVHWVVTDDMRAAVRFAPSSAHWSERLKEFFGPDAREGINALEKQLREARADLDRQQRASEAVRDAVEICPECDIAGCRHIRQRSALSAQPGAQKNCNCATCRPHSVEMRMILCEVCGDKRCPHAADHRNECTSHPKQHNDGGADAI